MRDKNAFTPWLLYYSKYRRLIQLVAFLIWIAIFYIFVEGLVSFGWQT